MEITLQNTCFKETTKIIQFVSDRFCRFHTKFQVYNPVTLAYSQTLKLLIQKATGR